MNIDIVSWLGEFSGVIVSGVLRIVLALFLLFLSFKLIRVLMRKIERLPRIKNSDKTVSKILIYALSLTLRSLVILALVSYVGIDTGGITTVIASLGVGLGLAVNGTLSNFAGGFLIILTRPFRIDDYIEAQGYSGTVEDIRIVSTKLRTPDNKVVYIPNGALSGGNIVNYSEKKLRRLDLSFLITGDTDVSLARTVVEDSMLACALVLDDPEPSVRVRGFGMDGTELFLRAWLKNEDYWTAYYDITEAVQSGFVKRGIAAPEKHINVRLLGNEYDKNRRQSKN